MSGVPNVFGSATSSIPLSQLDVNFNTPLYIGNTSVGLGNTVTSFGNVTLTNATISGNLTATSITGGTANGVVYLSSGNVVTANPTVLAFDGTNLGIGVTPISSNIYAASKYFFIGQASTLTGRSSINFTSLNTNVYEYVTTSAATVINSSSAAAQYSQYLGAHYWQTSTNTPSANSSITWNAAMTLTNSGYLNVGTNGLSYSFHALQNQQSTLSEGTTILNIGGGGAYAGSTSFYIHQAYGANAAATAMSIGKNSSTSRSINAGGSINQNGADYAEYMTKVGNFTINKGDICGIDVNGKLTNVFANSISFVVKSTDPGLVGGDNWGTEEALGLTYPQQPKAPVRSENESDADWATAEANYQTALATYNTQLTAYNTALEAARQMVDRIAFSGQVPINVTGATAGQYIVPIANQDGSIGGEAVSESAMTLQQYMQSVGKVISVVGNVTTIIVKVA